MSTETPPKPSDTAIWLVENSPITKIEIENIYVVYWILTGKSRVSRRELASSWEPYILAIAARPSQLIFVAPDVCAQVEAWLEFEKKNKSEMETFRRLKAKFEPASSTGSDDTENIEDQQSAPRGSAEATAGQIARAMQTSTKRQI
jgi:hypothetical protein